MIRHTWRESRLATKAVTLLLTVSALSGPMSGAFAGDIRGVESRPHWGQYGFGPRVANRQCGDTQFGPPFFTFTAGYWASYCPYEGPIALYNDGAPEYLGYGPFTGAPPNSERFAPFSTRASDTGSYGDARPAGTLSPGGSR